MQQYTHPLTFPFGDRGWRVCPVQIAPRAHKCGDLGPVFHVVAIGIIILVKEKFPHRPACPVCEFPVLSWILRGEKSLKKRKKDSHLQEELDYSQARLDRNHVEIQATIRHSTCLN